MTCCLGLVDGVLQDWSGSVISLLLLSAAHRLARLCWGPIVLQDHVLTKFLDSTMTVSVPLLHITVATDTRKSRN